MISVSIGWYISRTLTCPKSTVLGPVLVSGHGPSCQIIRFRSVDYWELELVGATLGAVSYNPVVDAKGRK